MVVMPPTSSYQQKLAHKTLRKIKCDLQTNSSRIGPILVVRGEQPRAVQASAGDEPAPPLGPERGAGPGRPAHVPLDTLQGAARARAVHTQE